MARCGKACDKKALRDLNYFGHKTIHIDPAFARSRELKRENSRNRNLTHNDSVLIQINVSMMLTEGVEDASTTMYALKFMFG